MQWFCTFPEPQALLLCESVSFSLFLVLSCHCWACHRPLACLLVSSSSFFKPLKNVLESRHESSCKSQHINHYTEQWFWMHDWSILGIMWAIIRQKCNHGSFVKDRSMKITIMSLVLVNYPYTPPKTPLCFKTTLAMTEEVEKEYKRLWSSHTTSPWPYIFWWHLLGPTHLLEKNRVPCMLRKREIQNWQVYGIFTQSSPPKYNYTSNNMTSHWHTVLKIRQMKNELSLLGNLWLQNYYSSHNWSV